MSNVSLIRIDIAAVVPLCLCCHKMVVIKFFGRIGSLQLGRSCRAAKDAFADLAHATVGQPTRAFGPGRLAQLMTDYHISSFLTFGSSEFEASSQ